MPGQLELFGELPKEEVPRLNTRENYGIMRKDLNLFNYSDLKNQFFGFHNVFLPPQMLISLDSPEILAIIQATGMVKSVMPDVKNALKDESIEKIVSEMNKVVYRKSRGISRYQHSGYTPHLDNGISQERRLQSLDKKVKKEFIGSFSKDYVGSVQQGYYSGGILDPNSDGRNKEHYIRDIFDFIKETYKNASRNT